MVVVVVVIEVMIADNSMKMKYIILSYYNCITAVIHSDTKFKYYRTHERVCVCVCVCVGWGVGVGVYSGGSRKSI